MPIILPLCYNEYFALYTHLKTLIINNTDQIKNLKTCKHGSAGYKS